MGFAHELELKLERKLIGVIINPIAKRMAVSLADSLTTPLRPFAPEAVSRFAATHNKVSDQLDTLEKLQNVRQKRQTAEVVLAVDKVRDASLDVVVYNN